MKKFLYCLLVLGFSSFAIGQVVSDESKELPPFVSNAPEYFSSSIPVSSIQISPDRLLASVHMLNGNCQCSSTVIGDKQDQEVLILCNRHCVLGNIGAYATFHNPTGKAFEAQLIATASDADLSLFKAKSSDVLAAVKVGDLGLDQNSEKVNIGYPSGHGPKVKSIEWSGYSNGSWSFVNTSKEWFGPGDSGGGIFYGNDLVGVVWGYQGWLPSNYHIRAVPQATLVSFVEKNVSGTLCKRWRRCPPGSCNPPNTAPPPPNSDGWQPQPNVPVNPPPPVPPVVVAPPAPTPPGPPIAPAPPAPVEPPTPSGPTNAELQSQINQLQTALQALTLKSGPPGPAGTNGKDGVNGTNGKDVDPTALSTIQQQITALQGTLKNHGGSLSQMQSQIQSIQNMSGHTRVWISVNPTTGQPSVVSGPTSSKK